MAIYPSTSEERGRSLVSKPLSASNEESSEDTPPDPSPKDEPECSGPNEEVHVPKDDAPPTPTESVEHVQNNVTKPRDFASDSEFWLHMTTSLDACFSSAKSNDEVEPEPVSNDLARSFPLHPDAPGIMQTFLSHGEACTKIEAEALDLVSNGPFSHEDDPLKPYHCMLDDLEQLQDKANSLEISISHLVSLVYEGDKNEDEPDELAGSKLAAHSDLRRIFTACLPVLRARKANLTVAQDLIDSAQENVSMSLKMESLGIV